MRADVPLQAAAAQVTEQRPVDQDQQARAGAAVGGAARGDDGGQRHRLVALGRRLDGIQDLRQLGHVLIVSPDASGRTEDQRRVHAPEAEGGRERRARPRGQRFAQDVELQLGVQLLEVAGAGQQPVAEGQHA